MKNKSSKKNLLISSTIIVLALLILLAFIQSKSNNNSINKYGLLSIDYTEFEHYKDNYNLEIDNYNYDIHNRFDNPEDLQLFLQDINKINYIYQDILFMHSVLTKEKPSYILEKDKNSFLNMINKDNLTQWNEMLIETEKSINKDLLIEEEIHLLNNISTMRELIKNTFEKSFSGKYDTDTLSIISENIEEHMGYLITINLMSEGHNKEDIETALNGLKENKETFFKESFYYKYMLD